MDGGLAVPFCRGIPVRRTAGSGGPCLLREEVTAMGRKIAKVAVAKAVYAIDKPYDYLIPRELEGRLEPGMRVLVPFAPGNRGSDGIVLSV